jgi:hypothetical protein
MDFDVEEKTWRLASKPEFPPVKQPNGLRNTVPQSDPPLTV